MNPVQVNKYFTQMSPLISYPTLSFNLLPKISNQPISTPIIHHFLYFPKRKAAIFANRYFSETQCTCGSHCAISSSLKESKCYWLP